jgi:hypothetical protein
VTIARALSDTYAGIAPAGVLAFIGAQLVGADRCGSRTLVVADEQVKGSKVFGFSVFQF